jgi:lipoate---protein ligase
VGAVSDAGADGVAASAGWTVARLTGPAGELHARPVAAGRLVDVLDVTEPALVLGSAQPDSDVAPDVGVAVTHRRSGGGAVLLVPGEFTWIDVTIPRDDALHDDDVARAFHWLGDAWARALDHVGIEATVHTGPMVRGRWSSQICFAGTGAGEVLIDGRKAVGISQRRTRDAVRFQSVVFHRWDPDALLAALAIDDADAAAAFLHERVTAVEVDHDALVAALRRSLP